MKKYFVMIEIKIGDSKSFSVVSCENGEVKYFEDLDVVEEMAGKILKESGFVCHIMSKESTIEKVKIIGGEEQYFIQVMRGNPGENDYWEFVIDPKDPYENLYLVFTIKEKAIKYAKLVNKSEKLPCRVVNNDHKIVKLFPMFYLKKYNRVGGVHGFISEDDDGGKIIAFSNTEEAISFVNDFSNGVITHRSQVKNETNLIKLEVIDQDGKFLNKIYANG